MAMEREKNACPMAERITDELIFERSGLNRKRRPSSVPGMEKEQMTSTAMISNSRGIISLLYFSMPPCTPRAITQWHMSITATIHPNGSQGEAVNWLK